MYKSQSKTQTFSDIARRDKRNKFIRKSRYQRMAPITRTLYGKSIIAKLSSNITGEVTGALDFNAVYSLQTIMSSSADWANFRDAYALYNILHVTVQVYPQSFAYTVGQVKLVGVCYDTKNNNAIGSIGSIHDHNQYLVMNFNTNAPPCFTFRTKAKPLGTVPQSTSSLPDNWGWIKFFGDNADFGPPPGTLIICKVVMTITAVFNSQQ